MIFRKFGKIAVVCIGFLLDYLFFGCADSTPVNYVLLCHDSAIQTRLTAFAAPSYRK
jgi:hypothetical protein